MMRTIALEEMPDLVGQELGVSDWFLMDQQTVDRFAEATSDHTWIHVDVDRAEREYGGTIAHGFLTLSMLPHLMESAVQVVTDGDTLNYGLNRVRFTNPVRVGKRIRARQTLLGADPRRGGLVLRYKVVIEIEGEEKPALVAEMLALRGVERAEG